MKNRRTKAGQLLKVAYATYRSGAVDIAKDIFVLAMEDPSAPVELGADEANPEELTKALQEDIAKGDFDSAKEKIAQLETLKADLPPAGNLGVPTADENIPPAESALSPGDEVPPPPPPELAPAQVASLVTLARRIKADGHPDLSQKITQALGL